MTTEPTHQGDGQRKHTCPECGATITAPTEREFEAAWERHKAEHRQEAELEQQKVLEPTDEELAAAKAKAQASAAALEQIHKNEADHLRDLEGHFDALSRIEHKLPQLIDFAFKIAQAVARWAEEQGYRTKALKLGTIYWTPTGEIAAEFTYEKHDISAPDQPEYLKRGYVRLPKLNAQYPAVFELTMTLGEHLVNIMNNRRMGKRDISFTGLHNFTNPQGQMFWAFKILNKHAILRAAKIGF